MQTHAPSLIPSLTFYLINVIQISIWLDYIRWLCFLKDWGIAIGGLTKGSRITRTDLTASILFLNT